MTNLSVVLPNYNHAAYLPGALTALLEQERPADEIILVDDGSTDESLRVIEDLASGNPSIRLIANQQNEGVIAALSRGLCAASGRYVYLAAADDWVLPGFFELALRRLDANPAVGLFCGESLLVDGPTGVTVGTRPASRPAHRSTVVPPEAVGRLLRKSDNWILTGSSIFRRDCLTWAGAFDEDLGSFADGFVARKIALTFGFYFEPRVVAAWRIYPESTSRRRVIEPVAAHEALVDLPRRIAADPVFPRWYPDLFARRWRFTVARLALQHRPIDVRVLDAVGVRSPIDQLVLVRLSPRLNRALAGVVSGAWLWLRLRPADLRGLVRTSLSRWRTNRGLRPSPARSALSVPLRSKDAQ